MKRTLLIVLAALLCVTLFAGCAGSSASLPAATVGDETISVTQLENMYLSNVDYASYYGYSLEDDAGIEAFQDYLLEQLVQSHVKLYEAKKAGITLTEEELAEAKKTAEASYEQTYQSFVDAAKEAGASDVTAYAKELLTDALVRNKTTVKKMKQDFLTDAESQQLVAKHKEQLLAEITPDEAALKAVYDEQLASQQTSFDADTAAYFTQEAYYGYGYGYMPLYMPAGLFRVRHILVDDEATAKEVKEKLDAGEDFETLLAEYNTDPGMDNYPDGYLIGKGANFVEAFLTAAMALEKDGDVSDVVNTDYGYHIIKRVSTEEGGVIPYADIQEAFETYAATQLKETQYSELVSGWMAEEGLVTYYADNYRSIGKAA